MTRVEGHEFYADPDNQTPQGPARRRKAKLTELVPVRFPHDTIEKVRTAADADEPCRRTHRRRNRTTLQPHRQGVQRNGYLAGDLVLDPSERSVRRGETAIDLTPREFGLLRYLMHRRGEPVSKRDLIEHVWADDDLEDNVVQVYVGYLRRKVDEPFGRSSIETVRGHGYRLSADGG